MNIKEAMNLFPMVISLKAFPEVRLTINESASFISGGKVYLYLYTEDGEALCKGTIDELQAALSPYDLRYRDPSDMPHLGIDAIHFAWSATWSTSFKGHYKGCPAGSGRTSDEAIKDLIIRTNRESGTCYVYAK